MISVKSFSAEGNVFGLLRKHIARVAVNELDIEIPPDHNRDNPASDNPRASGNGVAVHEMARTFVIHELMSNEGRLVIIPSEPDKRPKIWNIHRLQMTTVSLNEPMPFVARLENAVPPGHIETSGSFGPQNLRRFG